MELVSVAVRSKGRAPVPDLTSWTHFGPTPRYKPQRIHFGWGQGGQKEDQTSRTQGTLGNNLESDVN